VVPRKVNDRVGHEKPSWEDSETGDYENMPFTSRHEGYGTTPDGGRGGDYHLLRDGNHRITAQRTKGAMFHRVRSYAAGGKPPAVKSLPRRKHPGSEQR